MITLDRGLLSGAGGLSMSGDASVGAFGSPECFAALLDAAPDAVIAVGVDGRMVLVNVQAERLFGYPREELVGELLEMLVPERYRGGHGARRSRFVAAPRHRAMGSGLDLFGVRRDGREFPVEISLSRIRTDDGVLVAAAIRDVSERKQAEREGAAREIEIGRLNESAAALEAFELVAEHAPVGILACGPDGTVRYANRRWTELAGVGHDRCLDGEWQAAIHPDDRDRVRDAWPRLLAADGREVEFRFLRADGTIAWVIASAGCSEPDGGDGVCVVSISDVSALKASERHERDTSERLRESQAQLQALLDHAPMAITLRDLDGRVLVANGAAQAMIDASGEYVLGDDVGATGPTHERGISGRLRAIGESGEVVSFEIARFGADGCERQYLTTEYPVCGSDGNVVAIGGVSVDITERKRAEVVSNQLAAIIASTDDAVIGKTLEAQITSWNAGAQRIYGYSAQEAIGQPISLLLAPGGEDEVTAILARLRAGERVEHLETVRRRKDGRDVEVSLTISPVCDGAGAIIGASTIARDVSEQNAIARRLRASEQLLRTTIDHAPIGIAVVSLDGRCLRVNRALCEMTGYSEAALLDCGPAGLAPPEMGEIPSEHIGQLLAGEIDSCELERCWVHADGTLRWALIAIALVRDDSGAPGHFVAQAQDITQRREDRARLATHAREQDALRALATMVASEAQPRAVLQAAAECVAEVLQADFGAVACLEATGQARLIGTWSAAHLPQARIGALLDLQAPSAVATTLRTGRLANVSCHDQPLVSPAVALRCGLAAPIEVNGKLWGAVSVGWTHEGVAQPDAGQRIARIADLVSLAVTGAEVREQLSHLASTDHLTGLYNQRAFSDRLEVEVERARRHDRPVSLVVLDLDHFKLINDTHGHEAGNRALAEFAQRLTTIRRSGEVLARVGGEEFAWILPDTTGEDARGAAERARRAIADTPFPGVGALTTSAGVCALDDAEDAPELFRHADLALYWAKSNGRNTTFRYNPTELSLVTADEQADRLARARALAAVRALAIAVDAKDPSTQRHSERVADLAARLARAADWSPERVAQLKDAALVHDVGKIAIPDKLLLKPGRLTSDEYDQVKAHPALGAQMLDELLNPEQIDWIRHHHERYDGAGYPDQLAGHNITEGARLLALADAWDAMTVARSYGTPRTTTQALDEIQRHASDQFCPDTVKLLHRLHDQGALAA